jgi:hypothetical protein
MATSGVVVKRIRDKNRESRSDSILGSVPSRRAPPRPAASGVQPVPITALYFSGGILTGIADRIESDSIVAFYDCILFIGWKNIF